MCDLVYNRGRVRDPGSSCEGSSVDGCCAIVCSPTAKRVTRLGVFRDNQRITALADNPFALAFSARSTGTLTVFIRELLQLKIKGIEFLASENHRVGVLGRKPFMLW